MRRSDSNGVSNSDTEGPQEFPYLDLEEVNPEGSGKRQKRSGLACVRCRRRHVKCPGGHPCAKCVAAKVACEYIEPNKKLVVSMKYLQKLQSDLADMKRENVKLQAAIDQKHSAEMDTATSELNKTPMDVKFHKNSVENNSEDEEIVPNFAERRGRLVASRTGQQYFVGSSSMTLFGLEIQSLIPKSLTKQLGDQGFSALDDKAPNSTATAEPIDEVLQEEGNAYKIVLSKNDGDDDVSVNFTLPSYSYAVLLIDTFITYNDGCFYFFNEGLVKDEMKNIYDETTSFNDNTLQTIWFCKVLLIFATGEMYLGISNNANGTKATSKDSTRLPGSGFFEQASKIFSCLFSSGRVENVTKQGGLEVMLLYAFYLQVADCTVASYFYFGQALRACLIMGWHVDAQRDTISRFDLEHRRRLWWTVYMFDRMLSSKAGLPLSFADESITTELPGDFNMSNPPAKCEHYIFPEAEYITNCVKITQINAQILNKLYQRLPTSNILPTLREIVMQLLDWRKALSSFLQVDFTQKDLKISRLRTNVFTEYFQGMNLAIRPLLFHFASLKFENWRDTNTYINLQNYSKTISSLLNCSLQASINTIRSLWYLKHQNMVALFGYMDREYLFTSACTLLLFNAAFGIYEQTAEHLDHALLIFTKMRNLGNNPAGLRRAQILKLMCNLDFQHAMKELIAKHCDDLKPDVQYENQNYKETSIISIPITKLPTARPLTSDQTENNADIATAEAGAQIIENNTSTFEPLSLESTGEIQKFLDGLDKIGAFENELWTEISNRAMWLGNAVNSAGSMDEENIFSDFHISNFSGEGS
ncbi:LAME_0E00606g1_1 [Lachancea meyersii CBS 8951]|uniref:LAME_0E00606g1_1 n=1 Tax=Lachancea meyersii CBS 8951 TaxID=1266667 RepID=A0A1G4JEK5_9SACH|nr:LAME_0E00606g1_1 [Lachancea meyersii CBS 8951]